MIVLLVLVRDECTAGTQKPRGTRPGASGKDSCQRAGTYSGVVVTNARCMSRSLPAPVISFAVRHDPAERRPLLEVRTAERPVRDQRDQSDGEPAEAHPDHDRAVTRDGLPQDPEHEDGTYQRQQADQDRVLDRPEEDLAEGDDDREAGQTVVDSDLDTDGADRVGQDRADGADVV